MTDLVLAALILLIILLMVGGVMLAEYIHRPKPPPKHPNARWTLEERPRATNMNGPTAWAIYAVHPDEEPQLIDAVYWNDPDFESKVEEVRCQADMRVAALNSRRQLRK
jgi:hypothetical protein